MKITNLKKKIGAALLAAGMITPVHAASVGVNLVVDPSFEDITVPEWILDSPDHDPKNSPGYGQFATLPVNSWTDGSKTPGYTYWYVRPTPPGPPTFAKDADSMHLIPNRGEHYFSANFETGIDPTSQWFGVGHAAGQVDGPGQIQQLIDVSSGDSAAAIAAGDAEYLLSGWFGSYGSSGTTANLWVRFINSGGGTLGITEINGTARDWNFQSEVGAIPIGTETVAVSVYGDGAAHLDNANFTINPIPEPTSVILAGLGILGVAAGTRRRRED